MSDTEALILLLGPVIGCVFATWVSIKCVRRDLWQWQAIVVAIPVGALGGMLLVFGLDMMFDLKISQGSAWLGIILGALLLIPFVSGWFKLRRKLTDQIKTPGTENSSVQPSTPVSVAVVDISPPPPPLIQDVPTPLPVTKTANGVQRHRWVDQIKSAWAQAKSEWAEIKAQAAAQQRVKVNTASSSVNLEEKNQNTSNPFSGKYRFDYSNHAGEITQRTVWISHVSQVGERRYFEGTRSDTGQERSYRVDRVIGEMMDTSIDVPYDPDLLADLFGNPIEKDTAFTPSSRSGASKERNWLTGVYFAGFGFKQEQELTELAESHGWMVFNTLHHTVDYMVVNGRSGRVQRIQAEELGITIIDADTFHAIVNA
jgi:hypothetical protein